MIKKQNQTAVIILAAGMGTRMKSNKAKVLHEVLGKPMVLYVVETAEKVAGNNIILVVGNQAEKVQEVVSKKIVVQYALQPEQLGTGHAVSCALPYVPDSCDEVVILYGDVPLITDDTILHFISKHRNDNLDITLLAVEMEDPYGYGRIIMDKENRLKRIVEEADAIKEERRIKIVNTGIYCVKKDVLSHSLSKIKPNNVQGEFYLTDIVEIGYMENKKMGVYIADDGKEFHGINSYSDLTEAENLMRF